jgi:hypothetical protein
VLEYLDSNEAVPAWSRRGCATSRKLGVTAQLPPVDFALYQQRLQKFEFDITSLAYGGTHNPGQEYADLFGSKAADTEDSGNHAGVKSPAVDALMAAMTGAKTKAELLPACRALELVIAHSHYLIPQWTAGTHRMAYNAWRLALPAVMPPYAQAKPGPSTPGGRKCSTMFAYILKRLLLMVPTLLGVLLLTFVVIQFVPGGPVEQYLAEAKAGAGGGCRRRGLSYRGAQGVDPKRLEQIKALYGFRQAGRMSASVRCWGSSRASTWGAASSRTRTCGADQGKAAGVDQPGPVDLFHQLPGWPCRWAWPRRCGPARALTW